MTALPALAAWVGVAQACTSLRLSRATVYRQRRLKASAPVARTPPLKLDAIEQAMVLDELMSPRFVDRAPHQIYATLLDEGRYLCSIRTPYRLLALSESRARAARATRASGMRPPRAAGRGA